jgi:hypothetical protein
LMKTFTHRNVKILQKYPISYDIKWTVFKIIHSEGNKVNWACS